MCVHIIWYVKTYLLTPDILCVHIIWYVKTYLLTSDILYLCAIRNYVIALVTSVMITKRSFNLYLKYPFNDTLASSFYYHN